MKKQYGMSLIESLISIAVLGFGIVATTKIQVNMTLATQVSKQRVEAVALARSKIEVFRSTGTCNTADSGNYTPLQGNTTYNIAITCTDTKTPKLVVAWNDSKGGQTQVSGGIVNTTFDNKVELNTTLEY